MPALAGSTAPGFRPGPRRPRRGPALAVGGAAAVAALVAVGVILLTRGSPATTPHGAGTSTPAGTSPAEHASTAVSATVQPAAATIPPSFAGTWTGTATMSAIGVPSIGLQNDITFTMAKGGTTAQEVNDTCTNTLTLTKATATVLTFNEPGNALCVAGTVTFTLQDSELSYVWTDGIEKNAATLRKKK